MTGTVHSPSTTRTPVLVAAGCAAGLMADLAFDPVHTHVPMCPFHAATGWWCPLCGGLRAAYSLAHLRWQTAWHDNMLVLLVLPLFVLWWGDWALRARTGRPRRALSRSAIVALVLAGVVFTVVRNLPFAAAVRPL